MLNVLEKHKDVVRTFRVEHYDQEGDSYRIKIGFFFSCRKVARVVERGRLGQNKLESMT